MGKYIYGETHIWPMEDYFTIELKVPDAWRWNRDKEGNLEDYLEGPIRVRLDLELSLPNNLFAVPGVLKQRKQRYVSIIENLSTRS